MTDFIFGHSWYIDRTRQLPIENKGQRRGKVDEFIQTDHWMTFSHSTYCRELAWETAIACINLWSPLAYILKYSVFKTGSKTGLLNQQNAVLEKW